MNQVSPPEQKVHGRLSPIVALCLFLAWTPATALAQDDGIWTTFLNGNEVNDLVADGDMIFAATSGGALRLDTDGTFTQWNRSVGGLSSDSLGTVAVSAAGEIWFGTDRVGVAILEPQSEHWSSFVSLLEPIPGDQILSAHFDVAPDGGEALLVGTETGYAIFVDGDLRFVCQDGVDVCEIPSYVVTDLIYWQDEVWIATEGGVVRQNTDGSWIDRNEGTSGQQVSRFIRHGNELVALTSGSNPGILSWGGDSWTPFGADLPNGFVPRDLFAVESDLWLAGTGSGRGVYRLSIDTWERVGDHDFDATSLAVTESGKLFAGATDIGNEVLDGIWGWDGSTWEQHRVAGPPHLARYRSLTVDSDGVLWFSVADRGRTPLIGSFDDQAWSIWKGGQAGAAPAWTWDLLATDGAVYLAHCCCSATSDDCTLEQFDFGTEFIQIEGVKEVWSLDQASDGAVWAVTNNTETLSQGVVRIDPKTGESRTFHVGNIPLTSNRNSSIVVTDDFVWIGSTENGLLRWNLGANDLPDTLLSGAPGCNGIGAEDDYFNCYDASDSGNTIISNAITRMEEGANGEIWIGTTQGISIYNGGIFKNISPQFNRFPTGEVTALAPSPDGGAWVATAGAGLTRMLPDGDGDYTYTNYQAPLLPNPNIESLAVSADGRSVWCGTSQGLAKFTPFATGSGGESGDLGVYPNPMEPGCQDGIRILGVGGTADGVVVDVSGRIVSRFEKAAASDVIWDGKVGGEWAAPGIYTVQIRSRRGLDTIGVGVQEGGCRN